MTLSKGLTGITSRLSRVPGRRREGQRRHNFDPKRERMRKWRGRWLQSKVCNFHSGLRLMGLHDKATGPEHKRVSRW